MTEIHVNKYELIQKVVDLVEEEYGEKAVDKIDAELLAEKCLDRMRDSIIIMLETARMQVDTERSKVIRAAAR